MNNPYHLSLVLLCFLIPLGLSGDTESLRLSPDRAVLMAPDGRVEGIFTVYAEEGQEQLTSAERDLISAILSMSFDRPLSRNERASLRTSIFVEIEIRKQQQPLKD